jgi:hypothetical protein
MIFHLAGIYFTSQLLGLALSEVERVGGLCRVSNEFLNLLRTAQTTKLLAAQAVFLARAITVP